MADAPPPQAIKTVPKPRDQHLRDMADCIRFLSMDAVQQAKSGHPGAPMGMADIATVLFKDFINSMRQIHIGSTATALCCRTATPRCCSTASSI